MDTVFLRWWKPAFWVLIVLIVAYVFYMEKNHNRCFEDHRRGPNACTSDSYRPGAQPGDTLTDLMYRIEHGVRLREEYVTWRQWAIIATIVAIVVHISANGGSLPHPYLFLGTFAIVFLVLYFNYTYRDMHYWLRQQDLIVSSVNRVRSILNITGEPTAPDIGASTA